MRYVFKCINNKVKMVKLYRSDRKWGKLYKTISIECMGLRKTEFQTKNQGCCHCDDKTKIFTILAVSAELNLFPSTIHTATANTENPEFVLDIVFSNSVDDCNCLDGQKL